jgi:hypothetical protein
MRRARPRADRLPGPRIAAWLAMALAAGVAHAAPLDVEERPAPPDRPRVILAPRPGPTATLRLSFAAGSADEVGSPGLAHLTQHALVSANARLDEGELYRRLWASAARLELEVGRRETTFTLTAPRDALLPLARLLLPALLAPRLQPDRLQVAAARAVLGLGEEDGGLLAVVARLAARDEAEGAAPEGRREVIESLELAEVESFATGHLTPGNLTVVAAGAFDRAGLLALLEGWRGGQRAAVIRIPLSLPARRQVTDVRELHLLAHPVTLARPQEAAAARVAVELLRGALWRAFREAGHSYSFEVELLRSSWLDALAVVLPARDLLGGVELGPRLRAEVARVRRLDLLDAELEHARAAALAELARVDREPAALAEALATSGVSWHGPAVAAALRALDRAALKAALEPWLAPGASAYVLVKEGR